tara:strand:- start:238 stop:1182 length:945 start_codon:yes stop_codon:yes gene_type:complete
MYNQKSVYMKRRTEMTTQTNNNVIENAPTLNSSAMLVELNISKWDARTLDKDASIEVEQKNQTAHGLANVHKKLLGHCEEHITLKRHISNARNLHYSMTLPWSKSGLQLVPTSIYFKYIEAMTGAENKYWKLLEAFLSVYDQAKTDAKEKFGLLFRPENYPSLEEVRRKFRWSLTTIPLPTSGDFRVDIGNEGLKEVQTQYAKFYDEQLERSMNIAWQRLYDVLVRMSDRLDYADDENKKVFRDTLVTNVSDVVDLLDDFNLTNNQEMKEMKSNLDKVLRGVTADALREDTDLRHKTKKAVDDAIKALPSLDIL